MRPFAATGYIFANVANEGLITCDIPNRALNLTTNGKSNSGLISAQNGRTVDLNGITLTQSAEGVIRATGAGSIAEANGTIVGGTWEGVSDGVARTGGNLTLDGVTLGGTVAVTTGNQISVVNSITNSGTLTINPSGGVVDASISFNSPAITLNGGGTIALNPIGGGVSADAGIVSSVATNVVTNPADATIRGNGYILANVANDGLITCDIPNRAINLTTNPKSNSGMISAQNGGTVDLNGVTLTQSAAGVFRATGAGSIAEANGTIIGGTWGGVAGGLARTGGALELDGVTLEGDVSLQSAHSISASTFLTNNSVLTVNPSGGSNNATLVILGTALTIDGSGTVVLNGVSSTNDANISGSVAATLTCGPDQTIAGRGQIIVRTILEGTLSPGSDATPVSRIEHTSQTLTMTPSAVYAVDINGLAAGQFDTVACSGTGVTLDGTLNVTVDDAFVPALGDEFVVMTHGPRSGTFEQIITPNPGLNNAWRVRYEATRTVLTVTCPPDVNGDHTVGLDDLATLLSNFGLPSGAQGSDGDLDGDTDVDLADLAGLLAIFGANCP